jgi:hypothetical protein
MAGQPAPATGTDPRVGKQQSAKRAAVGFHQLLLFFFVGISHTHEKPFQQCPVSSSDQPNLVVDWVGAA